MAGPPELFVVCKSCQAEVSPYITECPYCGSRLRKRAPKLDRGGTIKAPKQRRRRPSAPSLSRLRPGEMPGVRSDGKPVATMLIVLVSIVFTILVKSTIISPSWSLGLLDGDPVWEYAITPFLYYSTAYEVVALGALFVFGWLLERRHGFWAPLLVFVTGTAAGFAVAVAVDSGAVLTGANAGALAMLGAWVVRDLQAARRGQEIESDLLGVGFIAALLLLLPAALYEPDPLAGITGALAGLIVGHGLARLPER